MLARLTDGGRGISYNEALMILADLTHNFTEMEGSVKVSYEYERSMVVNILKQHYQQVESVSDEGDMKYQPFRRFVIMYSHPIKDKGMWKYDAYGQERRVRGSEDIMKDRKDSRDDLARDLLEFIDTELLAKIQNEIEKRAARSIPNYYEDMAQKEFSQYDIDTLETLRYNYAEKLVELLLYNHETSQY